MADTHSKSRSRLADPGIKLLIVQLVIAAIVFIWWPNDTYWMGISLVGWLMFVSVFIWSLLTLIYVFWMEKIEGHIQTHKGQPKTTPDQEM